jgi:hypothetical protein
MGCVDRRDELLCALACRAGENFVCGAGLDDITGLEKDDIFRDLRRKP